MTEKGKHLYNLFGKRQRAKEKSLLFRLLIQTFTKGFYDRLLSKGKLFFDKPGLNNRVNSKYVDKNNQRTQPRKSMLISNDNVNLIKNTLHFDN